MYCFSSTYVSYSESFYLENNITALYMIFLRIPFLCNILTSVSVHVFLTYHTFCNILPLHHYMFFLHIAFLQHPYLYINTCSSYIHFCNILTFISVYVFPTEHLLFNILSLYHYIFFLQIAFLQHTYLCNNTCFLHITLFFNICTSTSIHAFPTYHSFATYLPLHLYTLFLHIPLFSCNMLNYLHIFTFF